MTIVKIGPEGFTVKGHCTADSEDLDGKLVCAAVSSAAYMAANTITDVICDKALAFESDGQMAVTVKDPSDKTKAVLDGFALHMKQLEEQYKGCVKVYLEV